MKLDDVPAWGVPVAIVIALLMILSRQRSGAGTTAGYGQVIAYEPVPADPGLVQLALSETDARLQGFSDVVSAFTAGDLARVSAGRDVAVATMGFATEKSIAEIQADMTRDAIAAEERLGYARETTARYETDAELMAERERITASSGVSLAEIGSRERLRQGELGLDKYRASTERYSARRKDVFGAIGSVVKGIGKFFGF